MISVTGAIEKIRANTHLRSPVKLPLEEAAGFVLAEDIFAGCSVPNFRQASMDGYALRHNDLLTTNEFSVTQEIAAGDTLSTFIPEGNAVRIFTGAAVPQELDTVVMQEKVEERHDKIIILDRELKKGTNVRPVGSEIKKGEIALAKNTRLSPAAIGFLAGIGITGVEVYPKPIVHLIITGKELIKPGQGLKEGQVYESNSLLLHSALKQLHIRNITIHFVDDDLNATIDTIGKALLPADLILLTGGVSVGNYDFVVKAAAACNIEQLFHKVKQRPGKPLYAGTKHNKFIFGLPGNPASVLTCFYNYVVTAIECMTGQKDLIPKKHLPLAQSFTKRIPLTQFLRAQYYDEKVTILSAQESFRLSSFSIANCLVVLPEQTCDFMEGEKVETLLLPYL
jgi:molybdopterin molybdotransferase